MIKTYLYITHIYHYMNTIIYIIYTIYTDIYTLVNKTYRTNAQYTEYRQCFIINHTCEETETYLSQPLKKTNYVTLQRY